MSRRDLRNALLIFQGNMKQPAAAAKAGVPLGTFARMVRDTDEPHNFDQRNLNMLDEHVFAGKKGHSQDLLDLPVIPRDVATRTDLDELRRSLAAMVADDPPVRSARTEALDALLLDLADDQVDDVMAVMYVVVSLFRKRE